MSASTTVFIPTIGIREGEKIYAFAEECSWCGEYAAFEGYRNICWRCV